MPIKVTCTNCGGVLHAPDDAAGSRGRCPSCGTVLTIPTNGQAAAAAPNPTPAAPPPEPAPRPAAVPQPPVPPSRPAPTYGLAEESAARPVTAAPRGGISTFGAPSPEKKTSAPAAALGSKVPPDPRRASTDPFTRPGQPAGKPDEADLKRWKRVKGGLGWVQTAVIFILLGVVAAAGLAIATQLGVHLPDQNPGFAKLEGLSAAAEIRCLAVGVPLVLGLLCLVFGRMSIASAPVSSFARGTARWASFATLVVLAAVVAFAGVTAISFPQFVPNPAAATPAVPGANLQTRAETLLSQMTLRPDDIPGITQRYALTAFAVFFLVGEVWYVAALGRMAAVLQSRTAAGRVNRFVILVGLLAAVVPLVLLAYDLFAIRWVSENVVAKWNGLDVQTQTLAGGAAAVLVGLVVAVIYLRLAGGVRGAIREYLDTAPAV